MLFKYFIRFQVLTLFLATVVMFQNCGGQFQFKSTNGTTDKIISAGGTGIEDPPGPTDEVINLPGKTEDSLGLCWVPLLQSNGKSQRISINENVQTITVAQGVSKDACITRNACLNLLPAHFNASNLFWRATAVCEHNKNVDHLSDTQVIAILSKN